MAKAPADVILVGGGIMGCASALALARAGARVTVLERSVPGAEASSAAAGILGAQAEAHEPGPLVELFLQSRARYRAWAEYLQSMTGIDVGFRACGVAMIAGSSEELRALRARVDWQKSAGLEAQLLDASNFATIEPNLGSPMGGARFPHDGRVDPPLLLRALHIAAARAGAGFQSGAYVKRVLTEGPKARGVELEDGTTLDAACVVVAAGSWSSLVGGMPVGTGVVRPARGQIVELDSPAPLLSGVVFGPGCYLVPRDDGRVLVGSTLEFVGYRREVTARAVRDLLDAAIRLVPRLADAAVSRTWSSFRPHTSDGRPLLGATDVDGLVLATGHYRNGILLAPLTGEIVAALAQGRKPPVDLAPFAPARAATVARD